MYLATVMRIPNVDGMLRSISGLQFTEWMAYFEQEPFGELREDYRNAHLMALIANVNRDPEKTDEFTTEDFLLQFEAKDEDGPVQEIDKDTAIGAIRDIFYGLAVATGGMK